MSRAVTIKDIARECGVGVSTVSRALNNHPDINPETRERIMAVVRENGFIPNDSARYLKRSDSKSIALVVKGISNPFFIYMIRIMEDFAQKKKYSTILRHVDNREDEVMVAASLVKERKLRGIVFLGGDFQHDDRMLSQLQVPFVFCTIGKSSGNDNTADSDDKSSVNKGSGYASVAVDDVAAAYTAVSYLIDQGHSRIGMIAEGIDIPSVGRLRYEGYLRALKDHGIAPNPEYVAEIRDENKDPFTMQNGYKKATELLKYHPEITAIFCISDIVAIGACRAISDFGKRIPEDISVIGFDGIESAKYSIPRLTTMKQPIEQIAEATIQMLFDLIDKKIKPIDMVLPAELIVRESTGSGYRP